MPVFVDPRSGELYSNVPDEDAERAQREFGLVPQADWQRQQEVEQAGEGTTLQTVLEGAAAGAMAPGAWLTEAITGRTPGETPQEELPPDQRSALTESVSGPEARLRAEAHPIARGIGTAIGSAPASLAAGAAAGAVAGGLGAGALAGTAASVLTEAAVEGVVQEYDDAWLEQRPTELANVASNIALFAGLDFGFRGALKAVTGLGTTASRAGSGIGQRNVVSEAQGAAREIVDPVGARSVGAASAEDMADPFDDAIRQMSDQDAATLARDAEDHYHLIAQDASEAMTRLNVGLTEDVGNRLKYEDFAKYAEGWDEKTLARQEAWLAQISEESQAAVQQLSGRTAGTGYSLDLGNLGKKASRTIDDFNRRVLAEPDPARRLVLTDEFKKRLDAITMSVDASFSVDNITRNELKDLIAPTREALRSGLQNKRLFGEAAALQKSLNEPWHHLLESWRKVQSTLTEATGHVQFDVGGAGRVTRESTVDRMMGLIRKDPRSNQEFGRHLARSLEGIQGLVEARKAHGITRLDGLDAMADDIRNMMEDWNLASTIGVARSRVDALKRDPRKWGTIAANLAERLPMVGQPIQMARSLGEAFTDLHIKQGTPLARVWDSAYQRYALNPVYQDPSILRNYPDWIQDSLRNRGGKFPAPPAGGAMSGSPAMPGAPGPANQTQPAVAQPGLSARAQEIMDKARGRAERRQSQGGAVFLGPQEKAAEPRFRVRLFRAAQDDYIGDQTSFSPSREVAEAYLDNPGFGGPNLFQTRQLDIPQSAVLDIRGDADEQLNRLLELSGRSHPGAATFDAILAEPQVADALRERGYEWVRLTDNYPEGAETWTRIGGDEEPELIPAKSRDGFVREVDSAVARAQARAQQGGSVALSGDVRGRPGFGDLPAGAQGGLAHAAFQAPQNAFTKEAKAEVRAGLAANKGLSDADRKLALDFVDSIPDQLEWNGKLARKYGRLIGRRGEGAEFRDELMRHVDGRLEPDDPMMKRLYHDPKMREAFSRGVDQGAGELEKTGKPLDASAFRSIREAIGTARTRSQQGGAVTLQRAGKWEPKSPVDKLVDSQLRGWDDDEVLAELTSKGDLRKYLFGRIDHDPELYAAMGPGAVDANGDLTAAARRELKAAIKAATDDLPDYKALRQRAEDIVYGEAPDAGSVDVGGPNFSPADIARSPMGVVTAAGGIGLGARAAMGGEPEPPPAQPPAHAYRAALREIDSAGQQEVRSLASTALSRRPPRGKQKDPIALFSGKRPVADAIESARERLEELAADPMSLVDSFAGNAGQLAKTHPSVYMALTQRAAQVASYLQSVVPPRAAATLLDPKGAAPSFDRAWDFAARFVGATRPRDALREVARGWAPPEMVEAVKATWPELWDGFRLEMVGQVQRMSLSGRHLPSEKLRRLDALLELDGQLDPSGSVAVAQHFLAAQAAEQAKREQGGQQGGGMPASAGGASYRTRLEQVNQERQIQ